MRALILLAGPVAPLDQAPFLPYIQAYAEQADYIVAADGGWHNAQLYQIQPHAFVGDCDSLSAVEYRQLSRTTIPQQFYPVRKDQTDGEIALADCIAKGARELMVVGSLASCRPDHVFGNILLLLNRAATFAKPPVYTDGHSWHYLLGAPYDFDFKKVFGTQLDAKSWCLSLIPFTHEVTVIQSQGLSYPLSNTRIQSGTSLGQSNEPKTVLSEVAFKCDIEPPGTLLCSLVPSDREEKDAYQNK